MQNNFSVLSANSCFDRCDNYISFKCSCFVRCQIDGNCCQDFQETCPKTFNQSIARFSEFLQSLQECKYSDYLMISRCPSENHNTQQPSSSFQFDNTSGLISEALQNIAEGHGAVSLLFRLLLPFGRYILIISSLEVTENCLRKVYHKQSSKYFLL
ncbi:death inducer-obliterator 1 [Biomphalaria glabrata]|nr:hypothetical protein BgiMline_032454 [Biomphalaria glabrata]